ncbi:MAG TPA: hypothetical protein VFA18_10750, partial [Gemmataceae bacterium]|nr:hypothetical protein [Gemmataceae bacterium]
MQKLLDFRRRLEACVTIMPTPGGRRWPVFVFGCLPPFLLPVAIAVCGVVFAAGPPHYFHSPPIPEYPAQIIDGLFFAHLPLAIILLICWPRQWLAVGASSILAGYCSLEAWFISGMSVTGCWL